MNKDTHLRGRDLLVIIFLIMVTFAVFSQVLNHEFINYDDDGYVTNNHRVQAGLTHDNITWAFTATELANWHPLTWLSHMLDCQLYGLNPRGHHLTSVLLHLLNTVLLYLVLRRFTKAMWQSAFVAALFALHPLHLESVAWVAERKDVLSTLFWMLTLWAYLRYVEHPGVQRYLVIILFFTLGLLAKPMLVTLPFVLLLLDYWPLGRFQVSQAEGDYGASMQTSSSSRIEWSALLRLVLEKVPLFVFTIISSFVTFRVQQAAGAVKSVDVLPIKIRLANGLISYIKYMAKMIWPQQLAVFYPHPGSSWPMWQAAAAGLLLAGISVMVILALRRYPYLAVGWFWYLGTLVPVTGLVQVGGQAMADRYTYVPLIGLFIVVAWGVPDLVSKWRYRRVVLPLAAAVLISALIVSTWKQLRYWQNSITLFEHALAVTENNHLAHNNLGNALAQQGRIDEAMSHFLLSLKIKPNSPKTHNNIGVALLELGNPEGAIAHFSESLRIQYDSAETHNNLGASFIRLGEPDKALSHLRYAVELKEDYEEAHNNLGNVLLQLGELDGAMGHFNRVLEIRPTNAEVHNNLGVAFARQGRLDEAIDHFREAVRLKPDYMQARANLQFALQEAGSSAK